MSIFRPKFTTSTFSSKKKKKKKSADHKPIKIKGLNSDPEDLSEDSDNDEIRGAEDVYKAPVVNEIIKENYNFDSFKVDRDSDLDLDPDLDPNPHPDLDLHLDPDPDSDLDPDPDLDQH